MKIFITGATGFIGRNLAKRLADEGHEIICGGRSFGKIGKLLDRVKTAYIDLGNIETILDVLRREKPDAVYHSAALVESISLKNLKRVNVDGTENMLKACLAEEVKRVIYLSTVAVVSGNPEIPLIEDLPYKATNPYGESKLEAEKIALEYRKKGLKIAIIRPCFVYGENEPHGLSHLVKGLKMRVVPVFGKGENRIHLVSVDNVVDVLVLCLSREEAYEGTYFVADKEALSMKGVLNYIAEIIGAKPPIVIPVGIVAIFRKLPYIGRRISFLTKDRVYSIRRLEEKLGYIPKVSTYEGLRKAVLSLGDR